MKRIILILSFFVISLFSNIKAQYNYIDPPDSSEYDLLYVFDTNYITNCFLTDNPEKAIVYNPFTESYSTCPQYMDMYIVNLSSTIKSIKSGAIPLLHFLMVM